ncbi:uncharacterized protein V6R79_024736, partial [Siganus canaliculatus]
MASGEDSELEDATAALYRSGVWKHFAFRACTASMKAMLNNIGVMEGIQPTYIYPEEVKMLVRCVFAQDICDYPDPCHDQ